MAAAGASLDSSAKKSIEKACAKLISINLSELAADVRSHYRGTIPPDKPTLLDSYATSYHALIWEVSGLVFSYDDTTEHVCSTKCTKDPLTLNIVCEIICIAALTAANQDEFNRLYNTFARLTASAGSILAAERAT